MNYPSRKIRVLTVSVLAALLVAVVVTANTTTGREVLGIGYLRASYHSAIRELGIPLKVLRITFGSGITELKISLKEEGTSVAFESDGIKITGSLYRPPGSGPFPVIVLMHGSSPAGRKHGFYTLLGTRFAAAGYIVLTIDLRGFGESEDPRCIDRVDCWDVTRDVRGALDYLFALPIVDTSRIYLIGHSMGGGYAMATAAGDKRIRKVIAIGPTRRTFARILAPAAPDRHYFHKRFSRDRGLDRHLAMDVFLDVASSWDAAAYLDYFSGDDHQPILLIDGGLESKDDLLYLKNIYDQMTQPKHYVTITHADHYANTMELNGVIVYDSRVLGELTDIISVWLKGQADRKEMGFVSDLRRSSEPRV
jgi:dienelactone hydrolase